MHRRQFLVLATAFVAAGCTTEEEYTSDVGGTGGTTGETGTYGLDTGTLSTDGLGGTPQPTIGWVRQQYGDTVLFEFDSAVVTPRAEPTVRDWAGWMQQFPAVTVVIEGHCDERGTREYNLALGDRRANAVRNLLIALGVQPNRVATISYGKERPAAAGHDEAAWAQNRRAVLTIG